ncbi:MAG: GIY-YIG nuclease family protein [Syntrophothermus sp.]
MYYTYIIKSLKDNTFYYGSTSDLDKRIKNHNSGKSKYTKKKIPRVLYYKEEFSTKREAIKREMFFKSVDGYIWLKKLNII